MSDQYNEFLNTIAGKLNKEELVQVKSLITALELNQETMQEVSDMLTENAENALSVAADEFNRRMAEQEERSRKVQEEARDRMELSRRLAEPVNTAPASSFYDPDGELKPVPVTLIAGDDTPAQHFTNTNVKQFIEKRLSLALVALQNSHSLNEPTTANLSGDQNDEDPAIVTIAWYVESIIGLIVDISEMDVVILED